LIEDLSGKYLSGRVKDVDECLIEKLAARAENYFMSFNLFIVTTDKGYISKVLIIQKVSECGLSRASKLIP
jgi:hypothetical protein